MSRFVVLLVVLSSLFGCGQQQSGTIGGACTQDPDCTSPSGCAGGDYFPDGYCTIDCTDRVCPDGSVCTLIKDRTFCTKSCSTKDDCRSGYQCFNSTCVPGCSTDPDCGRGFRCDAGQCVVQSGFPIGTACANDEECSSRLCLDSVCELPCSADTMCGDGKTCVANRRENTVLFLCANRRGTAAPASACARDGDCDRGVCQFGACVELCATTQSCHAQSMTCSRLQIAANDGTAVDYRGCLPTRAMLDFEPDENALVSGLVSLPEHARSFAIYLDVPNYDLNTLVGVTRLEDLSGTAVYTQPNSVQDFYSAAIRYQLERGTSTMLVPNAPARFTPMAGAYFATTATSARGVEPKERVYLKVSSAPITTGNVSLNFYVTDLSAACLKLTATSGRNGALNGAISTVRSIYQQIGVTIDEVTWNSTTVANVVRASQNGQTVTGPDSLESVLQAATSGRTTKPGFDVVLVRDITDPAGNQNGILGISGGIPSSPILGTPHSGVVVSISTACGANGQNYLAAVLAHEVGHSTGLFHNEESDGSEDPLTDTPKGRTNLMFWSEEGGTTLSPQQGQVVRGDPKIRF